MGDLDDDDLGVDLTPLIDVTFMLVIFFIMTMSFALPSIDLNLPQSSTAQRQAADTAALQLAVNAKGELFYQKQPLSLQQAAKMLQQGSYQLIEVNLDRAAPAQSVLDCADLARQYTKGQLKINTLIRDEDAKR